MLRFSTFLAIVFSSAFALAQTTHGSSESRPEARDNQQPASYKQAREIVRATPGYKNLQKIGLAFHGYHDIFGRFPPAVLSSPDGKTKYSWRVELLPVLKHYVDGVDSDRLSPGISREQYNALIQEWGYDITATWDDETNRQALGKIPEVYRHPAASEGDTNSAYYAVTGPGTAFDDSHVSRYRDIKGWVATTLMIVESRSDEPWTKPIDIRYAPEATVPRFGGFTKGGSLGLTCDGAVHFLHETTKPDQLRSLITRDQTDSISIFGIPYRYKN